MQPGYSNLVKRIGFTTPLIGFYDAPDVSVFEPLVAPSPGKRACVFAFYKSWYSGKTLHLTRDNPGCKGCGTWIFDESNRTRQQYIEFLADEEGLKASHELMGKWLDVSRRYQPQHQDILIGPLKPNQYEYLKSVTFWVNPDQLSLLIIGAHYNNAPGDPTPVLAPFGSGCMELLPLFDDLDIPQSILGATDIAMRSYLPPDMLAFTVTRSMFEQLCALDENSFLYKRFLGDLKKARGLGS
ncbi:DUF169 domain-containing protein [Chloroflexota bacterium]